MVPKYLIYGSYTQEGVKGFLKEGGTRRREATAQAAKSVGASLEAYYFAFGDNDFYTIFDAPDQASAIAASVTANASGTVNVKTVVLITPEEMDQALQKKVDYRPPGQ
jgi:uncharacterized protein with GYD domain